MRQLVPLLAIASLLAGAGTEANRAPLEEAERELFAARYRAAAELYRKALDASLDDSVAYYGLARALIKDHRSQEAYAVARQALAKTPQTAATQTAAGLAAYRSGDLAKAEQCFRSALRLDARFPGALAGLASVYSTISQFKKAWEFGEAAYQSSPRDPELMIAHANTLLKRAEHIAALKDALPILDPDSEEARKLRAHIASDVAIGERKLRRLTSPYQKYRIGLHQIMDGPSTLRGFGVRARLNGRQTVTLLLDTGSSGISLSPKLAERAGFERLGDEASDAKGIGDKEAPRSYRYLVSEVRIGDLAFSDYAMSVFKSAQSADYDGLIGANVFAQFLVVIDFPQHELLLEPRRGGLPADDEQPVDSINPVPAGAYRAFRFGDHLALPTFINGGKSTLFMVDSGSSANLLDTGVGREYSSVYRDDNTVVSGIQGKAKQASRADRVSLVFAGFRQDNPSLVAIDLERMSDDFGVAFGGILGLPVLQQLRVMIDYKEGTIGLQPRR